MKDEAAQKWLHKEVAITIDHRGTFQATVDDEFLYADTLEGIKGRIDKVLDAVAKQKTKTFSLKVVGLLRKDGWRYDEEPTKLLHDEQRGIHRVTGKPLYRNVPKDHRLEHVSVDVPGAVAALQRLQAAYAEYSAAQKHLKQFEFEGDARSRIEVEEYPREVERIIARYDALVKKLAAGAEKGAAQ
jgi:hypothetical protein